LNRSFAQLAELLDSEKASRMDKVTIISDAVKAVTQLRAEAHQLRQFKKLLEVPTCPNDWSHLRLLSSYPRNKGSFVKNANFIRYGLS